MISVEGLTVEFSVKPLFKDVSFVVNNRDRIALVGKNGAGKSTMLKILCGKQKPTAGNVAVPSGTTVGYLPQVMVLQDDTTVKEEARKAFADNTELGTVSETLASSALATCPLKKNAVPKRTDAKPKLYLRKEKRWRSLK